MKILYEDNHLLAVEKPAGLLTQPSGTDEQSLECIAKQWIKEQYQKTGEVYLHVIHRLDRVASGIVLFARTSKALSRLQAASRKKEFQKKYTALVSPIPNNSEDTLEHYLVHGDHCAEVVDKKHSEGKLCRLQYRVIENLENKAIVEIKLFTGRYHQIRAQFAAIDCPIVGDLKYGSQESYPGGIALHHSRLVFSHPTKVTPIEIDSQPDF